MSALPDVDWNELVILARHQGEFSLWGAWKRGQVEHARQGVLALESEHQVIGRVGHPVEQGFLLGGLRPSFVLHIGTRRLAPPLTRKPFGPQNRSRPGPGKEKGCLSVFMTFGFSRPVPVSLTSS